VLYKWFTGQHNERKPMTGPIIVEKKKSSCDEMKTSDNCKILKNAMALES
jgi:hypothetical protein